MKNEVITKLRNEADSMLDQAKHELERPGEDVTTHLICHTSRQALVNYLHSFLLFNDVEPEQPMTLEKLHTKCRSIDARFEYLDISEIGCRFEPGHDDYCLSVEKVDHCFQIAEQAKAIVSSTPPTH